MHNYLADPTEVKKLFLSNLIPDFVLKIQWPKLIHTINSKRNLKWAMEQKILPTTPMLEIELINPYPHLEEFLQIA